MSNFDRRKVLQSLIASGLITGTALSQARAQIGDLVLGQSELGLGFDSGGNYQKKQAAVRFSILAEETRQATANAIEAYRRLVARGGWKELPGGKPYFIGQRNPDVRKLRERLWASGDLRISAGNPEVYDTYVGDAVKFFQKRHGLIVDGAVNISTLEALNVSAEHRLKQLEINLSIMQDRHENQSIIDKKRRRKASDRRVVVNIPAARIEAVSGNRVDSYHVAVAGRKERQSPLIDVNIVDINFNPYWTVPKSIILKDLIPIVSEDKTYLTRNRLRISKWSSDVEIDPDTIDWSTDEATNYRFRQDPFEGNSLGTVRINMPNTHAVYMHDTPGKTLFGSDDRFQSSGCVRVQKVHDLVAWLLQDNPEWSRQRIREVVRTSERVDAKLAEHVPVHWIYFTAWASPQGVVEFRDDPYHLFNV